MELNEVLRIAKLSRIEISENECRKLQENFSKILDHFEQLKELNTSNVEALFHFEDQIVSREDSPKEALPTESLIQNAPDSLENCFKIPKVVGEIE